MMVPGGLRTGSARILPFRFGRQAVVPTLFLLGELVQKCLYVVPRNIFHWSVGLVPEMAGIVAHHRCPLLLCDRVLPQIKRLTDGDSMGWFFAIRRFSI